jgi:hypothetical protein
MGKEINPRFLCGLLHRLSNNAIDLNKTNNPKLNERNQILASAESNRN